MRKLVKDVKVIAGEECAPQHKLVVGDQTLKTIIEMNERSYTPRHKEWKFNKEKVRHSFGAHVQENLKSQVGASIEDIDFV